MAGFHLGTDPISCMEYLNDHLKILNLGCDEMTIDIERLKTLAKVHTSFIRFVLCLFICKSIGFQSEETAERCLQLKESLY